MNCLCPVYVLITYSFLSLFFSLVFQSVGVGQVVDGDSQEDVEQNVVTTDEQNNEVQTGSVKKTLDEQNNEVCKMKYTVTILFKSKITHEYTVTIICLCQ